MTKKYGGTGLGLAISAGFCRLMQGGISLHSEWSKGSTFFFVIPVYRHVSDEEDEPDVSILSGKNVLVVDDKVQNIIRLTRILEKYDIEYTTCQSPKHAIASYLNNPRHIFDFGMLDVYMPEMSGNELAEYITKTPNAFPLIALSSLDDKVSGISSYFDMMLQKPYSEEQLVKAMCSIIIQKNKQIQLKNNSNKSAKSDEKPKTPRKPKHRDRSQSHTSRNFHMNPRSSSTLNESIDLIPINDNVQINILIAEDNIFNQKTLRRHLNRLGYYNLTVVDSGAAAIKKIKSNNGKQITIKHKKFVEKSTYDIILMDIVMPGMTGKPCARKIQSLFKHKKYCPKIYAVTANVMPGDKENYLEIMDGYIEKPIDKEHLREILSQFQTS